MLKAFFTLTLFLLEIIVLAQPGCTDPLALNFDNNAIENDGSCIYAASGYSLELLYELEETLAECSGLAFFNDELWTHNDANNPNVIYRLTTESPNVEETVLIANSANEDWEDLAEDDNHIYIGDFGNKSGDRTNLRVYRINKSDLISNIITAELISFSYEDQSDFSSAPNNTNFDCEAFFSYNGNLHVFTKNWIDGETSHYVFPADPGEHIAIKVEGFDAEGLITSADINSLGQVVLLGYTEGGTGFLWLLYDYNEADFFSGNRRKISLGSSFENGQLEAICFKDDFSGFAGAERVGVLPARLFEFNFAEFLGNPDPVIITGNVGQHSYPNPAQDFLQVSFPEEKTPYQLFDQNGVLLQFGNEKGATQFDLTSLKSGIYFLILNKKTGNDLVRFIKQ